MTDIQFEEKLEPQRYQPAVQKPFLVRLVLRTGMVSSDKAAGYVLIGIAALATILAFAIPSMFGNSHTVTPLDRQRTLIVPG